MTQMNLFTKQTDSQISKTNLLTVSKGAMSGGEINQEFGMNVDTLLYVRWITNKDLL